GYLQRSLCNGFRCTAADAFLNPPSSSQGVRLLLQAVVEKIEINNGRAVAVSFVHEGQRRRATARDIVLCAGTVNSPQLLMLSGIGDPEELARHRIPVLLERPAVGQNLKEHAAIRLVYRSKIPTYNLTEGLSQWLGIFFKFLRYRE